ncbi:hypothetical protein [Legionella worsleiensis]|uniref:Uncharacterized protein n=1 Tax=Legionella worsleiensis TaxID=45076 RepID=A0A0W1AHF4_9GAMM|nr:hypothetical protein [Legionella worsleiensis]KTD80758.1 hypothetical protein Lwor_1001 [Legionella worsleiensis]STY32663.1 Uncharacterised protein [Legionella worsleiensis]
MKFNSSVFFKDNGRKTLKEHKRFKDDEVPHKYTQKVIDTLRQHIKDETRDVLEEYRGGYRFK